MTEYRKHVRSLLQSFCRKSWK